MKRWNVLGGLLVAAAAIVPGSSASAAGTQLRLPSGISLNDVVVSRGVRTTVGAELARAGVTANTPMKTRSGKTITVQQYFDTLIAAETSMGTTFMAMPAVIAASPSTEATIAAQQSAYSAQIAQIAALRAQGFPLVPVPGLAAIASTVPASGPAKFGIGGVTQVHNWAPADLPDSAGFNHEYGDRSIAAASASMSFVDRGTKDTVDCSGVMDVSAWIFGNQESIAHATIDVAGTGAAAASNATVSIHGQPPVNLLLDRTHPLNFSTNFLTQSYKKSIPLLAHVLSIDLSASASVNVAVAGTANPVVADPSRSCSATFNPHIGVVGKATGDFSFGVPLLSDLASTGFTANLTLVDIGVPTSANLALQEGQPPTLIDSLNTQVTADFLKGKLVATLDIWDPLNLLAYLHLKPHYEFTIETFPDFHFSDSLSDVSNRSIPFVAVPFTYSAN